MIKVDKIYINKDKNNNILYNECFVLVTDEIIKNKRINTILYYPGTLTSNELIALKDQLIITSHNGVFSTNSIQSALIKDLFILSDEIEIQEPSIEEFENNKSLINIKIKVKFKNNIDNSKPLLIGFINKNSKIKLSDINGRGPFYFKKIGDYIEVYCNGIPQDNKKYIINLKYIKTK